MAEVSTLARPYAEAVFRLAREQSDLAGWSERLALASAVASDAGMLAVVKDPMISAERLFGVFVAVCGDRLGGAGENLMRLLADNGRVELLPTIAAQFETLREEAEGVLEAEIETAMEPTPAQVAALVASLRARFGKDVQASVKVNPELIGGAIVSIGDRVIDGSVRGRIAQMAFGLRG
jgi:F-type H+-transporting ATPase subunit delta